LTTKMLASTMQISTNNQPTTHTPQHQHHKMAGMPEQAMPGMLFTSGDSNPALRRHGLFSQDSTGCLCHPPPAAPDLNTVPRPRNKPSDSTRKDPAVAGENVRQCLRQ